MIARGLIQDSFAVDPRTLEAAQVQNHKGTECGVWTTVWTQLASPISTTMKELPAQASSMPQWRYAQKKQQTFGHSRLSYLAQSVFSYQKLLQVLRQLCSIISTQL